MRNAERNGYAAAQLGFASANEKTLRKPMRGQFTKAGTPAFGLLREFRLGDGDVPAVGTAVTVADVFTPGEHVQVTGVSKGRGTTGVMKRYRFSGFPASHGTHEYFRHGGSIGNRSFPGRVFKGKRMAGRYGAERVTTTNIEVVAVRADENLLLVRGAVPGARNGTVIVRRPKGRQTVGSAAEARS
jgi:large subunit ribosomal protein L3